MPVNWAGKSPPQIFSIPKKPEKSVPCLKKGVKKSSLFLAYLSSYVYVSGLNTPLY
jgi:hypothetical protein